MFYNIAYCTGMNGSWRQYLGQTWRFFWLPNKVRRKIGEILEKERPDVVCLAEVDSGSFRNRFHSQAKQLAKKLLFPFYYTQTKYHHWSVWQFMSLIRKQNDAVLSKKPGELIRHELHSGMKKLVQEYIVDDISIFTVHLAVLSKRVRKKQLRELAVILGNCPRPYVLCGDFNIHKGLGELKEFIHSTGLRRLIKEPTFPSVSPKRYLDIFFASPSIKVVQAGVVDVEYSDHLPVWVEIAS
jgi:endonuclease/exonuclease/phosphatase family metal-dependent hydrolase